MTLILLASLAFASPGVVDNPPRPGEVSAPEVCLNPAEFDARVLDPLRRLVRCQAEVQVQVDELAAAYRDLGQAREVASRYAAEAKRAKRQRAGFFAGGAGSMAVVVIVLLVLL